MNARTLAIASALAIGCANVKSAINGNIPDELQGDVALAFRNEATDRINLYVTTITQAGASAPRALTSARANDRPLLGTQAGLIFTRELEVEPAIQALMLVGLDGKNERELARCQSRCADVTLGADGRLYYIDRQVTLLGTVMSVSVNGDDAREWEPGVSWNACFIRMSPGRDGKSLLLSANNELGWPECDAKVQGIYDVPLEAKTRGAPVQPHSPLFTEEDELHSPIARVWRRPNSDRLFFEARTKGDAVDGKFSCKPDGSDVKPAERAPLWTLNLLVQDEKTSLVATPPAGLAEAWPRHLLSQLPRVEAILPLAHQSLSID